MSEHAALPEPTLAAEVVERRRPGRRDYANPHLVALLRQEMRNLPSPSDRLVDAEAPESDSLAPARGILLGSLLGLLGWGVIALALTL